MLSKSLMKGEKGFRFFVISSFCLRGMIVVFAFSTTRLCLALCERSEFG